MRRVSKRFPLSSRQRGVTTGRMAYRNLSMTLFKEISEERRKSVARRRLGSQVLQLDLGYRWLIRDQHRRLAPIIHNYPRSATLREPSVSSYRSSLNGKHMKRAAVIRVAGQPTRLQYDNVVAGKKGRTGHMAGLRTLPAGQTLARRTVHDASYICCLPTYETILNVKLKHSETVRGTSWEASQHISCQQKHH
jgi:hypothetical protein